MQKDTAFGILDSRCGWRIYITNHELLFRIWDLGMALVLGVNLAGL